MCNYQEAFPTFYIYIYEKYHSSDGDLRPWIHNARDVFY
jgi:hypothetical protein